jgi:hypothetical protein
MKETAASSEPERMTEGIPNPARRYVTTREGVYRHSNGGLVSIWRCKKEKSVGAKNKEIDFRQVHY